MKNKKNLLEVLANIGLSGNEAAVYVASLEIGPSSILRISKRSGIKRTTVYAVIDSLIMQGLITKQEKGFKYLFAAENPTHLEKILKRKGVQLKEILPEFQALFNLEGNDSIVKYYEGIEGVRNVSEELLDELRRGMEYLVIGDPTRWNTIDKKHFKKFIAKRMRVSLDVKILLTDSPTAREYKRYEKNYDEEVKILPKDVSIDVNVVIVPHKLIIQQLIEPIITVVIENKSIINLQRALFKIIWNTLK